MGPLLDPLWQQCSRVNATKEAAWRSANEAAWRSANLLSLIAVLILMVPVCAAPVLGRDEFAKQLSHGVSHGCIAELQSVGCMGDGRMGRGMDARLARMPLGLLSGTWS